MVCCQESSEVGVGELQSGLRSGKGLYEEQGDQMIDTTEGVQGSREVAQQHRPQAVAGGHDLAAPAFEFLCEKLGQTDAVVLGLVDDHGHLAGLQIFPGIPGRDPPLEAVLKAGPKGKLTVLGHQRIGGGGVILGIPACSAIGTPVCRC
jgi:hypothetical protein